MTQYSCFLTTRTLGRCAVVVAILLSVPPVWSDEITQWPLRSTVDGEALSIYAPELESFDGAERDAVARAAFSVKAQGGALKFGAVRYRCKVARLGKKGAYRFAKFTILDLKFPGASRWRIQEVSEGVENALDTNGFVLDTEAFDRALSAVGDAETFSNDPPVIYYEESPAVLVFIDGKPVLKKVEGRKFKTVVNTAYFIVLSLDDNRYYLKGGNWWYRADDILGEWRPITRVPKKVRELGKTAFKNQKDSSDAALQNVDKPPKIIISTVPAELIVLDGPPRLSPVGGTGLLYIDNTENDVLLHIEEQQYYALFAGRWYRAKTLEEGNWTYVSPENLPAEFAEIGEDSSVADVLTSVPGTEAAEDATLIAVIPEVAAIHRTETILQVTYDGDPEFVRIQSTSVYHAVNADKTVLKINNRYYAVDEGVWFEASSPFGPWQVAVAVPDEVSDIPPDSPVYNVRYVYVYDYTPSVVYVGYTPGYYCAYVYHRTVVYGTGYYYRPWIGYYYYSRPVTYGFGVHFHPYVGWWGFPVGVTYGWLTFTWFPVPFAYWGPAGYMYGYRHGYYHGESHGYYHGYRNGYRHGYSAGRDAGYRAFSSGPRYTPRASSNLYRHRPGVVPSSSPRVSRARRPSPTTAAAVSDGRRRVSRRNANVRRRQGADQRREWWSTPATRPAKRSGTSRQIRDTAGKRPAYRTKVPSIQLRRPNRTVAPKKGKRNPPVAPKQRVAPRPRVSRPSYQPAPPKRSRQGASVSKRSRPDPAPSQFRNSRRRSIPKVAPPARRRRIQAPAPKRVAPAPRRSRHSKDD